MVLWFVRAIFVLLVASLVVLGFREEGPFAFTNPELFEQHKTMAILGCIVVLLIGLAIDIFVPRKKLASLAGIFFGLIVGLVIGLALNYVVELLYETYNVDSRSYPDLYVAKTGIKWIINVLCCYLAITFVMQTKDDFRFIIPYVEFSKQTKGVRPFVFDTSVIIDGRIADIAATSILNAPMVIPRFILNELQDVADSSDRLRRNRGRRGLDMLNKMQSNEKVDLSIQDIPLTARERTEPVDHQLVTATKKVNGKIVTNDYNLNKIASLRGVEVININDLANALKPVVLPGENMRAKMVKPGDQIGQGVGYMDDGTMVVVEQGRQFLGREIDLVVTSVLQTSAGRMIFGKLDYDNGGSHNHNRTHNSSRESR